MKMLPLLIVVTLINIKAFSQSWSGTSPGNIYYNQGNVGIGTGTPTQKLDVSGNIRVTSRLYTDYGTHEFGNQHWALTNNNVLRFGLGLHFNETGSGNTGSDFAIWRYQDNGGLINKALTIKRSNGFTGLKTDNPVADFQIGDRFTFMDGGWKGIGNNVTWSTLLNTNARIVAAPASAMFFTDKGNILFLNGPSGSAGSDLNNAIHSLVIHNSGQVGIGTSYEITSFSDQACKLFVEGNIRSRKVRVDQQNWADYVFDPAYQLPTLKEVEDFIKRNKHLPDVPSAKEVKKNGIDLGDNQAVLLKKIEELTLYLIQQNKKIEEQSSYIAEQNKKIDQLSKYVELLQEDVKSQKQTGQTPQ